MPEDPMRPTAAMSVDPMRPTAAMLKTLYDEKVKNIVDDGRPNDETIFDAQLDDALHMLSKFLIQRIRAWGIFKDGKVKGYLFGKENEEEYKYDLSGIKEVYETFKTCVYNPIFGEIDHADITYNIFHQNLVTSNRVMLKDMIDQMVHLYKGTLKEYRPRSQYISRCPKSDTPKETIVFTENSKKELASRLKDGFRNISENLVRQEVRNDWHAIFTYIFGPPYFNSQIITPQSVIQNKVVGTITQSGGKSTRRARTKKARRAKRHTRRAARHTRRAARREYRAR